MNVQVRIGKKVKEKKGKRLKITSDDTQTIYISPASTFFKIFPIQKFHFTQIPP